jgi:D-glycero-alpha-D-manno-heptose 1-phosphate guanylyltransferase
MIKEAIILAGGLGTRLRSVVPDLPKCMAPVAGKPFLYYVIAYLKEEGIRNFVFSVGYKSESIVNFVNKEFLHANSYGSAINFQFSTEDEPLGTGGAIKQSGKKASGHNVLVCNGDTLFKIDVQKLNNFHLEHNADCTLCLKPMNNFERYGVVEINNNGLIKSFKEKQFYETGFINGGVYALNIRNFMKEDLPEKFSFEKDYLEKYVEKRNMYGVVQDGYFIDIGIPEDYERAGRELNPGPYPAPKSPEGDLRT